MRPLLAALGLWSGAALLVLLFDPGGGVLLTCMRLVGRGPACDAAQAAINDAWWRLHALPILAAIAAGYLAIVIVRVRGMRRRRS